MLLTLQKRIYRMKKIYEGLSNFYNKEINLIRPENRKYYSRIWIEDKKRATSKTYDGLCIIIWNHKIEFWTYYVHRGRVNTQDVQVESLFSVPWIKQEVMAWYILNLHLFMIPK